MINLSPINKKIRTTLENRSQAVKRGTDVNFGPQTDGDGKINASDTFTKSLWIKVFSPVDATAVSTDTPDDLLDEQGNSLVDKDTGENIKRTKIVSGAKEGFNTVTILGGQARKDGTMFHGFDSIYTPRTATKSGKIERTEDGLLRPIAGIKDISVGYKGGLSAIREATINWVCWSFEDLENLSPHFFSHGKGLLIEWGWGFTGNTSVFDEEDMKNGTAYQSIQNRIIENGGNYDAMAGVISNWEWTLRADGGFDCMTKVTSRGVNMLDSTTENPGLASYNTAKTPQQPSLPEFCGAIKESVYSLSVVGEKWFGDGPEDNLPPYTNITEETGNVWSGDWKAKVEKGDGGTQPPGVFVNINYGSDFWGWFSKKHAGPYLSWGFFEDNVLSRFLGKYSDDTKLITSSFRSIQPVLADDESGDFLKVPTEEEIKAEASSTTTSKIHEAQFESTIIRNHKHLYTPFRDRWILPGQFPGNYVVPENAESKFANRLIDLISTRWDEALTEDTAQLANEPKYFRPFAVDTSSSGWSRGGYLRNILVSYEIIEDAFKNAKTLKEGVQTVLDELNRDVDGFWRFEIVVDPYIDGNCKIIDMNATAYTVKELLDDKKAKITSTKTLNGNPESKLFTFPSWGEASIVKTQTLKTKVPSAMAVTAMYAGNSKQGEQGSMGDETGTAVGLLTGGAGLIDLSQQDIRLAWRAGNEGNNFFGSISPYGNIPSKGPRVDSGGAGQRMAGDGNPKTNVPSSDQGRIADFGYGHGVPMKKVEYAEMINKADEHAEEREEEIKEAKANFGAKGKKAVENFLLVTCGADGRSRGQAEMNCGKDNTMEVDWWWYHEISLYDENGNMWDYPKGETPALFRRTMMDFIHGNIPEVEYEHRDKIDVLIPIEMEITIDGIGGILPGNVWTVDYIPERYRKYCVFQTLSINQTVSGGEWTTTLKGQIRPAMKYLIDEEIKGVNKEQEAAQAELGK